MRRLKKNVYLGIFCGAVAVLGAVRGVRALIGDSPAEEKTDSGTISNDSMLLKPVSPDSAEAKEIDAAVAVKVISASHDFIPHRIYSVPSFDDCFPDLQDVQIVYARKNGVKPVQNRDAAEKRKSELVYVGSNPYFKIDKGMRSSIPYLVPKAADLLQDIARNFLDSLYIKGVPLHKVIVTSVLRSEEDVAKLRKHNQNASDQSCHRFGTTFDICYNRYVTVAPPGETRRVVQNDTLKWILSEVLRDIREQDRCCIKHEKNQSCFHITVK